MKHKRTSLALRLFLLMMCLLFLVPYTVLADEESASTSETSQEESADEISQEETSEESSQAVVTDPSQGGVRVEGQFVYDFAELLENEEALEAEIAELRERWTIDVVIVTTDDAHGKSSMEYADDFFDYNGFGYDKPMGDGVLFLIDMDNRQIWISTCGKAIIYFTDSRIDEALDDIIEYMYDSNYDGAADDFLWYANDFMGRLPGDYDPYKETQTPPVEREEGRYVYDLAGFLGNDAVLETLLKNINDHYPEDVVILTVDDTRGLALYSFLEDFFVFNHFGTNDSGIVLAINADGYYEIQAFGTADERILTYERRNMLAEVFEKACDKEGVDAGCVEFVNRLSRCFEKPYRGGIDPLTILYRIKTVIAERGLTGLVVAVMVSAVVTFIRVVSGKPKKVDASQYLNETGGYAIPLVEDQFLGEYTTRTYSPVSESSSGGSSGGGGGGGGSSTHSSSSGTTHGGGGRSF